MRSIFGNLGARSALRCVYMHFLSVLADLQRFVPRQKGVMYMWT